MDVLEGKFGVILADPPWPYTQYRKAANGAAASAYECMDIEAIKKMPVASWASEDCVLALWTTGPMIAQGTMSAVLAAWGFTGKTMIPWLKNSPKGEDFATGVGIWFMANAEYVVFATRGKVGGFFEKKEGEAKPRRLRGGNLGIAVGERDDPEFWQRASERAILAPKDRLHSKKPTTLHTYLESFVGPRLELFARREHGDWMVVGREMGWELGAFGARKLSSVGLF